MDEATTRGTGKSGASADGEGGADGKGGAESGVEPSTRKVELVDAIIELVAAGLGVSVLSRWAVIAHRRRADLALAEVTAAGLPIRWSAVTRRADGERSPAAALARELAQWCRKGPDSLSLRSAAD